MNQRNFRILLVMSWIFMFLAVAAHFSTRNSFPPDLKSSLDAYKHSPEGILNPMGFVADLVYLAFSFIISVGIFFFKKWARALYLPCIILGLLLVSANGKIVADAAWVNALKDIPSILDGAILAIAYYSPLSEIFESKGDV